MAHSNKTTGLTYFNTTQICSIKCTSVHINITLIHAYIRTRLDAVVRDRMVYILPFWEQRHDLPVFTDAHCPDPPTPGAWAQADWMTSAQDKRAALTPGHPGRFIDTRCPIVSTRCHQTAHGEPHAGCRRQGLIRR